MKTTVVVVVIVIVSIVGMFWISEYLSRSYLIPMHPGDAKTESTQWREVAAESTWQQTNIACDDDNKVNLLEKCIRHLRQT